MQRTSSVFWLLLAALYVVPARAAEAPKHRKLSAVPFTDVKLQDAFWAPRIQANREKSLPHNFKWCADTGRISNFAKAAKLLPGKFEGIYFNDSDVYKVLEGAAIWAITSSVVLARAGSGWSAREYAAPSRTL